MSIRKINSSWWVDFRFNRIRYRKKSPENSKSGANAYELVLRSKLANGEEIGASDQEVKRIKSFSEFSWEWFDTYVVTNNKTSEILMKKSTLTIHLIPFFGRTPLDRISSLGIEKYKSEKLLTGLSKKSINNHLAILGKCLKTAKEWGEANDLPIIKLFKTPPSKFDFLSREESEILLAGAAGVWHDMILAALRTGMRLGELIGLRWEDINFGNRTLAVKRAIVRNVIGPPKSNRERHIPLADDLYGLFVSKRKKEGYVFETRRDFFLSTNNCYLNLRKICRSAGLRRIGWHVLRHTFASHLVEANASIKAIQELLGHTDIKTTMRYAHLAPSALQDTIALLSPNNFGHYMVNRPEKSGFREISPRNYLSNIKQKQPLLGAVLD